MNVGSVKNTAVKFQGFENNNNNGNEEFFKLISAPQAYNTGNLAQPNADTFGAADADKTEEPGGFFKKALAATSIIAGLAAGAVVVTALCKAGGNFKDGTKFGEAGQKISDWGSQLWEKVKSPFSSAKGA